MRVSQDNRRRRGVAPIGARSDLSGRPGFLATSVRTEGVCPVYREGPGRGSRVRKEGGIWLGPDEGTSSALGFLARIEWWRGSVSYPQLACGQFTLPGEIFMKLCKNTPRLLSSRGTQLLLIGVLLLVANHGSVAQTSGADGQPKKLPFGISLEYALRLPAYCHG